MIRFSTEFFPIIPISKWMKNKAQPIAIQNVMDYLLAALEKWNGSTVLEIGGPEIITYQEVMSRYAHIRGHKRSFLLLPYIPVWFMALGIELMTPVPHLIARALVGGLSHDSIVTHKNAHEIHPEVNLIDFETATKEALTHLHPLKIERVWDDGKGHAKTLKHEGFFIAHQKIKVKAKPEKIFGSIQKIANQLGSQRFVVDTAEPDQLLLLRSQQKIPGAGWLEWGVSRNGTQTYLTQTIFFAPRGTAGFLYWYLFHPFFIVILYWLLKRIARNSVVK
jgi:hypothetical protein